VFIPSRKGKNLAAHIIREGSHLMLILLALLLVLLFFGLGFAVHLLWIAAVILFVFWIVGFALGRGENSGARHFYRW
jgi:lysylphosphatidylglycerol synthetase-like protein (DUF2156 family)